MENKFKLEPLSAKDWNKARSKREHKIEVGFPTKVIDNLTLTIKSVSKETALVKFDYSGETLEEVVRLGNYKIGKYGISIRSKIRGPKEMLFLTVGEL